MESLAAEIESAIYTQLNTTSKIERKICEDVILKFRNLSQPYDLCKFILGQSKNPLLLYEVGKCLSNAVVREWTRVFCPPGYDLTISTSDSKPHQLLCFLLQWVASVGNEVQNVGRQSILTAASALVKRAAAEQAQMESKKMTSRIQTILSPPNDPGSASPIMSSFMDELGQLLAPSASFQQDESRLSFGLSILTAFIDEMANCGDYTKLNIPLEAHIFMQSRFEDFELLEILKMLLRLTNSLLVQAEWPGSVVETEFNFRLVHCLEAVTSWNFLPNHIIDLSCLRSTGGRSRDSDFRPRDKWVCVLGHEALPSTLGLLFNLHGRLRESASLGSGTLSCLISISNLQGSLVAQLVPKTHTIHVDQLAEIKESSPLVAHLTTMMECLSRWLPLREQRSASFECLLLRQSTNASDDKVDDCLAEFNVAPFSKALTIASMYQHMPRLECLRSYELPLLSELTVNLLRQLFEVFSSIESVICGSDNETRGADENRLRQIISRIFFYLGAMRKFLNLVCTVLSKCLLLEASNGDGEGEYDAKDAHEASERLFSYLADVSSLFRQIDGVGGDVFSPDGNTAISLTTGPTAVKDQFTELLKRGCNRVRQEMNREQVCLIRLYFASHLAAPVGFRAPEAEGRDEEWNLSIDMADQCAYEDSLFAIGQFSGSNGVASMAGVIDLLVGLLEERANLLTNMSPASNQISALMEDIHWLLLLSGHILVIGPSQTGSSRGGQPTWDSEFAIPDCIWKIGKGETHTQQDVESGQRFLVSATENTPVPANASNIPSLIRLFAVLFRLLRIQTSPRTGVDHIGSDHIGSDHVGSAQLTEDSLWLFVRICLTYLSTNQSDVSSSEETDSTARSLAHMILKGRSNHHSSVFPSCVASLVLSSRLAMSVWRGEPNITAYASCLLSVIARHSLVHLKQEGCPLWVELCGMVAGANAVSQTWSLLAPETLTELIDSCTRGCWSLRHANVTLSLSTNSGPRNDLFFQFVGEIRARVECVMQPVTATQQQEETESGLESVLAAVSGLARALRWIISSNSDDTNDLTAWFWTSFFLPILKNCATQLFQKFHMSHYLVSRILNLFYEIADNCLLYLTNCPVNITHDEVAAAYLLTNTQIAFNKNSGSTQFLTLTSILCAQYAQANCKKISCVAGDQERVSEIKLLLNLLQYFLGHEFELRLFGSAANGVEQTDPTQLCLTTVDVTLMCIGHLLPLLTASVLAVPNISSGFYSLLAYALEIRAEGLGHLISANQSGIADLGRLIRSGLFHSTSSNVSISCLEVVTYLCEFCLDARCGILTASAAVLANRIIEELPLDGNLLHELLSLAIRPEFAVEMEETLATCILCLAFLIPDVFQELIQQWLSGHTEGETRMRLQMAFVKLSVPIERALLHKQTTHQSALKRPTRGGRAEFQELFHAFILTVRAFLCSF